MRYDQYISHEATKREKSWTYRPLPDSQQQYPLFIASAGHAVWFAGERFSRTCSSVFALEYVSAGNIELVQDGKRSVIQAGEVYLLRKGLAHEYAVGSAEVAVKRYVVLAGSGLDYYMRLLRLWDADRLRLQAPQNFAALLKQVTTILRTSSPDIPPLFAMQLSCLAYQMLLELSHCVQSPLPPVIETALTFMHENLHRSLSREEICKHVGISSSHFNRVFSKTMGKSSLAYFLDQKFNWTAELLKMTTLSVKEIAYKAGFESPLYFSAQFKKRFGVSPQHYRNKIQDASP